MLSRPSFSRVMRCTRWQAAARRWSSTTTSFSVYGAGTKDELVERLRQRRPQIQNGQDAVVILASRPYASWLTDEKFMAGLLETLSPSQGMGIDQTPSNSDGPERGINVLAAVVEGLLPERRMAEARHGFSVYQGGLDVLLPELWTSQTDVPPPSTAKRGGEAKAALTFQTDWSLHGTREREGGSHGSAAGNPLACTLPLANTVFQNQRPFTLFANRWRRDTPGSPLQVVRTTLKQGQLVNCSASQSNRKATLFVPIGPVTPPRRILAGLGNIVRQVEINGKPVPASRELEVAIQNVYDTWAEDAEEGEHGKGRVGVWAIVVPPGAATEASIERLDAWQKDFVAAEGLRPALQQAMTRSAAALAPLLVNGSRLYQVLSGGGGWGKKQGLLSLDPDTKFSAPGLGDGNGDEDLESFVRAFKNEHGSGSDGYGYGDAAGPFDAGVVAPGSVVQFFVAPTSMCELGSGSPQWLGGDVHEAEDWRDGPSFGVTPRIPGTPTHGADGESWKVVEGTFGAVSSEAMYLSDVDGADAPGMLETKVNAPDSYLSRAT